MKFHTDAAFESSCLQGRIRINYAELVQIFGPENCDGDGYKVDAEWMIKFVDGTYATIYNYKDGRNYCGDAGLELHEITDWHVGGMSQQSVWAVQGAIDDHRAGIIDMDCKEVKSFPQLN